ncbi:MAG: hypothetical protein P1U63_10020 [Coxiellaceae bacterium]|nr:hypothetical protein [Coxiellaceae bacterium]
MRKFTKCCAGLSGLFSRKKTKSIAQQFIDFNLNETPIAAGSALDDFNKSIVTRDTRVLHDWSLRYAYELDSFQLNILTEHHAYLDTLQHRDGFTLPADMSLTKHLSRTVTTLEQALTLLDQSTQILERLGASATAEDKRQNDNLSSLAYQARRSMYHEMAIKDPAYFSAVVDISNLNKGATSEPFTTAIKDLVDANEGCSIMPAPDRYQIRIHPRFHGNVQYEIMATILKNDSATEEPMHAAYLISAHGALDLDRKLEDSNIHTIDFAEEIWDTFNRVSTEFANMQRRVGIIPSRLSADARNAILCRCLAEHNEAMAESKVGHGEEKATPTTGPIEPLADTSRFWQNPLAASRTGRLQRITSGTATVKRDERRPSFL